MKQWRVHIKRQDCFRKGYIKLRDLKLGQCLSAKGDKLPRGCHRMTTVACGRQKIKEGTEAREQIEQDLEGRRT